MEVVDAFGTVLRERRLQAQFTQEQLALEADIRRTYVSMLELGQHQPTLKMLFTLADALGCAPSDMLLDVERRLATTTPRETRSQSKPPTRIKASVKRAKK